MPKPTAEQAIEAIHAATYVDIYKCPECGAHRWVHGWSTNAETGEPSCGDCGTGVQFSHRSPAEWISIAAYLVTREYGGPEEGGWWYDSEHREDCTVRCFEINDLEDAAKYVQKLYEEWVNMSNTSAASRYTVRVFSSQLPVKHRPENRPTYS